MGVLLENFRAAESADMSLPLEKIGHPFLKKLSGYSIITNTIIWLYLSVKELQRQSFNNIINGRKYNWSVVFTKISSVHK